MKYLTEAQAAIRVQAGSGLFPYSPFVLRIDQLYMSKDNIQQFLRLLLLNRV